LDALELIEAEHRRLDRDLARLAHATPREQRLLARRLLQRLSAYLLAEERALYPALFATMGAEMPLDALDDHDQLKAFVAELLRPESPAASFASCVSNLHRLLGGYYRHQHVSLYPLMHDAFSPGERELVGGDMHLFLTRNRRDTAAGGYREAYRPSPPR
jgi:hypothetical protein